MVNSVNINSISSDYCGIGLVDGKKCFVDNALTGDVVNVDIYRETKKFCCAKIIDFIKKSDLRENKIKCKFYDKCGGCSLQHIKNEYYNNLKIENFYRDFSRLGFIISEENKHFFTVGCGKRRRINLKYNNGSYGFFEKNNNKIVVVDKCINVVDKINEIISLFRELRLKNLNSVDIFEGYNGIGVNLIFNNEPDIKEFEKLNIFKDEVCYINYTYPDKKSFVPIIKNDVLTLKLGEYIIDLPESFFIQATVESQDFMINTIEDKLINFERIVDLYCGVGTYSFPLSKTHKVDGFEGDANMVKSCRHNIDKLNIKTMNVYQRDIFNQPLSINVLNDYDAAVINPPRNGAENQCKFLSKSNVRKIIYVSCDKTSFLNDLKLFKDKFTVESITLVDQFYWSNHIEIICSLCKI